MTAMPMPTVRPAKGASSPWFGGSMPVARFGVIVNLAVPAALLGWDAWHHDLGADPVNFALLTTGLIAVTYLMLSLAVTPLVTVVRQQWLVQFRRAVGCWAFYFAASHLFIYFWWDRGRSLSSTVEEITHRYYLTIGFTALVLMVPLWASSLDVVIRWMGGARWKWLHRLAYVSAGLAVWHYYLQSKADKSRPEIFAAVLAGLLLWRYAGGFFKGRARPMPAVKAGGVPVAGTAAKARHWQGEMKVVDTFRETDAVTTFRLAPADGSPVPFAFHAGQFLSLTVPIDGHDAVRSYTIASSPTRDAAVELTVKREPHGHVSPFLHDMVMAGGTVRVSARPGGSRSTRPTSPA